MEVHSLVEVSVPSVPSVGTQTSPLRVPPKGGFSFPFGQIAAREHIVLPYDSHCVFTWAQVVVAGIG